MDDIYDIGWGSMSENSLEKINQTGGKNVFLFFLFFFFFFKRSFAMNSGEAPTTRGRILSLSLSTHKKKGRTCLEGKGKRKEGEKKESKEK